MPYAVADARKKFRLASENPAKLAAVREILKRHPDEPTLIISMYVEQIRQIAAELGIPVLTGTTAQRKRDAIYEDFLEMGKLAGNRLPGNRRIRTGGPAVRPTAPRPDGADTRVPSGR